MHHPLVLGLRRLALTMRPRSRALAVMLGGAFAIAAILLARQQTKRAPTSAPPLLVYNALARSVSLVDVDRGTARPLPCANLPRWLVRVGRSGDRLVALDTESPAIVLLRLSALVDPQRCASAIERFPIASGQTPIKGWLVGDRLYVAFFGSNEVAAFDLVDQQPRLVSTVHVEAKGVSAIAAIGQSLWVAGAGLLCTERKCPNGRYGPSTLHRLALPGLEAPEALTSEAVDPSELLLNGAGLYVHPAGSALFWLFAGDIEGGQAAIARVPSAGGSWQSAKIPTRGVSVAAGFPLDANTAALLGFSGPHVTLLDVRTVSLRALLRYDGGKLVDVSQQSAVEERSQADLQDLVALETPQGARFFLVDARGDRVIEVRFVPPAALEVVREIVVGAPGSPLGCAWAEWLR